MSGGCTDPKHVAVLGCGLMGGKMALRLASQGFKIAGWNRDKSKVQALAATSADIVVCDTAAAAVQQSGVVLIMLADGASIQQVLLDNQEVKGLLKGRTVLMMSTIGPGESKHIGEQVAAAGGEYVEAPVLGSQPEAEGGRLQILVGHNGDPKSSPGWPVLCAMTQGEPKVLGPVGAGASVKLALNQLIVTETLAFTASLGLVQKSGGDVDKFMEVLKSNGNYYAPTFDRKLPKFLSRDFSKPNFPTKHLLKDAKLFCAEGGQVGLDTRLQQGAASIIESALHMGLAEQDYSSVYEAVVHPQGGTSSKQ